MKFTEENIGDFANDETCVLPSLIQLKFLNKSHDSLTVNYITFGYHQPRHIEYVL